jgi:predicted kinase
MDGVGINLGAAPATTFNNNDPSNHSGPLPRPGGVVVDNPMPHRLPEGENAAPLVGLPATGKTHIAKRICRFLSFFHDIPAQLFNVGDYRRQLYGAKMPANFYDPSNAEGLASRTIACDAALADLIEYVKQDGVRIAAFDATNSTRERRAHIMQRLKDAGLGAKRMFVESICDQEGVCTILIRLMNC